MSTAEESGYFIVSIGSPEPLNLDSSPELEWLFRANERLAQCILGFLSSGRAGIPDGGFHPFQLMTTVSLVKGLKTHAADMLLCRHGFGQDAALLTRSLFELAVDVRYAAQEPGGDRARRWWDYDAVTRYESNQVITTDPYFSDFVEKERRDPGSYSEYLSEIERDAWAAQERWKFWAVENKKEKRLERPRHWSGLSVRMRATLVGWASHYSTIYQATSSLHHSDVSVSRHYISRNSSGDVVFSVAPSSEDVHLVLSADEAYLEELVKHWISALGPPESFQAEVRTVIDEIGQERRRRYGDVRVERAERAAHYQAKLAVEAAKQLGERSRNQSQKTTPGTNP